mmetsp:Transcript_68258/g.142225  ORF Transcript_68258/g.142225 Transcript_68258/m.142225 type:complete len:223 (-) Transcript_68258:601-1269(-)
MEALPVLLLRRPASAYVFASRDPVISSPASTSTHSRIFMKRFLSMWLEEYHPMLPPSSPNTTSAGTSLHSARKRETISESRAVRSRTMRSEQPTKALGTNVRRCSVGLHCARLKRMRIGGPPIPKHAPQKPNANAAAMLANRKIQSFENSWWMTHISTRNQSDWLTAELGEPAQFPPSSLHPLAGMMSLRALSGCALSFCISLLLPLHKGAYSCPDAPSWSR